MSKQELGTVASQSDADWASFAARQWVDIGFDTNNRPVTSKLSGKDSLGATQEEALTAASYDSLGRINCSAVRMDASQWNTQSDACTPQTTGPNGPDRISQNIYDPAGEVTQVNVGVGITGETAAERTLTYSNNGLVSTLKDAENNLTTYVYDGFDRPSKMQYPSTTKGSGTSSTTDYEQLLNYDANSNVGQRRLRDGSAINFTYDLLDRVTLKDLPGTEPDVTYGYDNLGRLTSASQSGNALSFGWDALGRKTSEAGPQGTASFGYDAADEKTSITYPTGGTALTINYTYLTTGELSSIQQSGTNLATYAYDNLGNRLSATFGNGAAQAFTYDPVSRLASLTNDLAGGTTNDLTATFAYNPASQISSAVRTGDAYAYPVASDSFQYDINGRNQVNIVTIPGVSVTVAGWDSKGNLTADPVTSKLYGYSSENLLTCAGTGANCSPLTATLAYDPALRLYQVAGASTTRFAYDGLDAIAEYNASNALQRRFVFDPTTGQPVVQYEGTGVASTDRRYLSADERGSVISTSDSTGASLGINSYDEYGRPGAANTGRFQYAGQKWLSEIGAYDYKARVYLPHLGVFAQTDPIGQADSPNLYAYVGGDPVNKTDPFGQCEQSTDGEIIPSYPGENCGPVIVWGQPATDVTASQSYCSAFPYASQCGGVPGVSGPLTATPTGSSGGGGTGNPATQQDTTKKRSPQCSARLQRLDDVGSDLQLGGIFGGGAVFIAGFVTGQPEVAAGGAEGGSAAYALGGVIRESVSAAYFLRGSGDLSGYTLSQFNNAVLKSVPNGLLHDIADSLLEKAEKHEGLTNGDAPICSN